MRTSGLPAERNIPRRLALLPIAGALCTFPLLAQKPPAPSAPPPPIVRVEVNLVQVDAIVTDLLGRQVTNLKPDDFEVFEDKKPRPIVGVNYVHNASFQGPNPSARTTFAFLIDDLSIAGIDEIFVQRALKKFVGTQIRPDDRVAILRTSTGSGAWDRFTNNRRVLLSEINLLRSVPAFWGSPYFNYAKPPSFISSGFTRPGHPSAAEDWDGETVNGVFAGGTLGALRLVLQGMSAMPGRKAIILFSGGLTLDVESRFKKEVFDAVHALTDLANRAGIVIYTVNATSPDLGDLDPGPLEYDPFAGVPATVDPVTPPFNGYVSSLDALHFLSSQTGGRLLHDSDNLNGQIAGVRRDLDSFYLVSFTPSRGRFDPRPQFHQIRVRVKKFGLRVRSRHSFFSIPDNLPGPADRPVGIQRLFQAVFSPFVRGQVPVVLTSNFAYYGKTTFLQNYLYIEPRRLRLTKHPGGSRTGTLDLALYAFSRFGDVAAHSTIRAQVSLTSAEYAKALHDGLVYNLNVTVPPGNTYQLRAAVLDRRSGRLGTASRAIVVPLRNKGRAALSSLEIGAVPKDGPRLGVRVSHPFLTHQFPPGAQLGFRCAIFDARTDPASGEATILAQPLIYRDDALIFTGPATHLSAAPNKQHSLVISGAIPLDTYFTPGNYAFVLQVSDTLQPKRKFRTRIAWSDFAIAPPRPDTAATMPEH